MSDIVLLQPVDEGHVRSQGTENAWALVTGFGWPRSKGDTRDSREDDHARGQPQQRQRMRLITVSRKDEGSAGTPWSDTGRKDHGQEGPRAGQRL